MTTIISSKSAKFTAGLVGLVAGIAMFAITAHAATFTTNLKVGSTGADVKNLQLVLNMSADTQVATTGAGSPGNETSYFGPATKAAVIKFQNKYAAEILAPVGLTSGTGFVGASTRAMLNGTSGSVGTGMVPGCTSLVGFSGTTGQSCATGSTTSTVSGCTSMVGFSPTTGQKCDASSTSGTVTTSGPISASLANSNPAAGAVVGGQATADLLHVNFTGNGVITNVKLLRTGISANATLTNVYLYEGNVRVADAASVNNTDSTITFNNLSIAVNGSRTLSVKADIGPAATTAGQIVGVALTGYTTSGNTMTTANISGNYFNVANAGSIASVSAAASTAASSSVNAGSIGYTFFSSAITVSTRAVDLKGATFKFIGSAPTDALANVRLYVNGTAVGPASTINSSNDLSFDLGSSPVRLNTGSATLEVRGDIVKGSSRTIKLTLQNSGDVMVMDTQLNVNVALGGTFPNEGGVMTVNQGSITTTIDPAFQSVTSITSGRTGATIASFKFTAYGEDVKVSTIKVTPVLSGMAISGSSSPVTLGLNNVGLFYNGGQVGQSQNWTSGQLSFSLGSSLVIAAGQTGGILEVRADVQNTANANYTAGTISANLGTDSSAGQGQSSYNTVGVTGINGTGLAVSSGNLVVAASAAYANQTVNPNTANVKIGSFVVQNTSTGESVRISNLLVTATTTGGMAITNLSNLRTSETSGSGSTPINPSTSNNFSVNFTLAAGQTKTIDVMADLGATSAGTIYTTLTPTAIGVSSNITLTPNAATGQTLSLAVGSLATPTLNAAPSSLAAQFVVGGSTPTLAQYNFVATNGSAVITELKFAVGGTGYTSTTTPVTQITVGGQTAPVVAGVAWVTGLNIAVPNGTSGANVSATASFGAVGVNGIPSNTTATTSITYIKYTIGGVSTSTTASTTAPLVGFASSTSNTMTVVGTKPSIAIVGSTDQLINGTVKTAEVTITADAAGDLKVNAFPINVTSTGAVTSPTGTDNVIVTDNSDVTISTTNPTFVVTTGGTSGDVLITFASPVLIPHGESRTYRIKIVAANVAATNALSTKLGASSGFSWNDMVGGVTPITGANIQNYPTGTVTVDNY